VKKGAGEGGEGKEAEGKEREREGHPRMKILATALVELTDHTMLLNTESTTRCRILRVRTNTVHVLAGFNSPTSRLRRLNLPTLEVRPLHCDLL